MSVKRIVGNIKIETGYILPAKSGNRKGRVSKYLFVLDMLPGESFAVPKHQYHTFVQGIAKIKKANPSVKIVSRLIDNQARFWRIA